MPKKQELGQYQAMLTSDLVNNFICCLKELSGNTDGTTVVSHDLTPPIAARYIRFRPIAWHRVIAMRVELYGCQGMLESLKAAIFCNFFLNFLMKIVMLVYIM